MVREVRVSFRWVFLSRPSPLLRKSCHPQGMSIRGTTMLRRVDESFRTSLIDSRYRPGPEGRVRTTWARKTNTVTGQGCQPLCAGDATKHLSDPLVLTETGPRKNPFQSFSSLRNLAHHSRPKRDPSRTILTWHLRHHSLPSDASFVPLRLFDPPIGKPHWTWRVRVRISEQARTRPGRIRLHPDCSFQKSHRLE